MANQPRKIDTEFETNEGYLIQKRDDDILKELVDEWNNLVDYLAGQ